MKIYTSFLDTELKPMLDSMPKRSQQALVKPLIEKLKNDNKQNNKKIAFLSQYNK